MRPEKKTAKKLTVLGAVLFLLFLPAGCTKKAVREIPVKTVKITATFYPLYIMCLNLTQGVSGVELSLLAPDTTVSLREYMLTTKDLTAVSSCDILVANGAGMERFIEQAVKLKQNALITAADHYPLIDTDPYIYFSPAGARYEVRQIADGLCRLDPEHSAKYRVNAEIYDRKLSALSDEMHEALKPYKGNNIIVLHEAFRYLAAEFGLNAVSAIDRIPGTTPSPLDFSSIVRSIKSQQKNSRYICLYAEQQYPAAAAEALESKTGLVINKLDPCVSGPLTPEAYTDAQEKNLLVLRQSLSDNYDDGDSR
jgi:zinc transport system substrate-binding protein